MMRRSLIWFLWSKQAQIAFPRWRETKVSYGCVERYRSIHLFCLLHAQI